MKRLVQSSSEQHRQIVITMNIEEYTGSSPIAANEYLDHPKSINKKHKISDKHLEYLNDIIASFDHNLQVAGFPILDSRPAKNSYSYYITFVPITESGEELLPVDLIFRVSTHSSKSSEGSIGSSFVRIKGFTLEHEDFDKASELIYEGIRIIRELKKGNVDILDEI